MNHLESLSDVIVNVRPGCANPVRLGPHMESNVPSRIESGIVKRAVRGGVGPSEGCVLAPGTSKLTSIIW